MGPRIENSAPLIEESPVRHDAVVEIEESGMREDLLPEDPEPPDACPPVRSPSEASTVSDDTWLASRKAAEEADAAQVEAARRGVSEALAAIEAEAALAGCGPEAAFAANEAEPALAGNEAEAAFAANEAEAAPEAALAANEAEAPKNLRTFAEAVAALEPEAPRPGLRPTSKAKPERPHAVEVTIPSPGLRFINEMNEMQCRGDIQELRQKVMRMSVPTIEELHDDLVEHFLSTSPEWFESLFSRVRRIVGDFLLRSKANRLSVNPVKVRLAFRLVEATIERERSGDMTRDEVCGRYGAWALRNLENFKRKNEESERIPMRIFVDGETIEDLSLAANAAEGFGEIWPVHDI